MNHESRFSSGEDEGEEDEDEEDEVITTLRTTVLQKCAMVPRQARI